MAMVLQFEALHNGFSYPVRPLGETRALVGSKSKGGEWHRVDVAAHTCDCPSFTVYRPGRSCAHLKALAQFVAATVEATPEPVAVPQRESYGQRLEREAEARQAVRFAERAAATVTMPTATCKRQGCTALARSSDGYCFEHDWI